jgi:hypothetical protein
MKFPNRPAAKSLVASSRNLFAPGAQLASSRDDPFVWPLGDRRDDPQIFAIEAPVIP